MREPLDIAIIGMAGVYAGARNVAAFWQNILDHVYAVSEASPEWSRSVLDPEAKAANRVYTAQGGWLHDLAEFDPREFGVMPNAVDGREPDHFLALKNARDALADAGYLDKPFNHERAGIILGRGNNTNRGAANLLAHGAQLDQMVEIVAKVRPDFSAQDIERLREGLRAQLPPFNPEMLPGLIPNVTTGVIANRLDLMGPNCIVDAACASSLVALEQAVRELTSGRCDLMLTGGVHAQTPPQSYMIFSQINALARDRIRPFQKGANGTLLGEGCGVVALKRLADAERAGDRIYAVIKGIGVASDGKAKGLFAPRKEGQVVAMRRAYDSCGIEPQTLGLVEAHATGIALGDRTEVSSLREIFGARRNGVPTIALGSVKSMISHAIPASGAASLIKCALALQQKVLPPMLCEEPAPELELESSPFYINNQTRPWVHGGKAPRRAGVNAFGFGGINAHVILEEHRPRERIVQVQVLHAPSSSELVLLGAADAATLLAQVRQLRGRLDQPGVPGLAAVAKACAARAAGEHRLGVVVQDLAELKTRLDQAVEKLARSDVKPFKTRSGLHYGVGALPGKLCFLFPGEGAQYPGMLADVCVSYPQVREWFDFIEQTAQEGASASRADVIFPAPTTLAKDDLHKLEQRLYEEGDLAAESVFAASMGVFDLMMDLGLKPDAMLGHSTGENTALIAARVRRYDGVSELSHTIHHLNRIYRELDAKGLIAEGTLLTLGGLRPEQRARLLAGPGRGI
ncbi:MAG TPA: beta-ketoacyl synthase N-terminal-like domain-containing protein, partial [Nevskiaceae bacterium]|nr:beta-ketoacyl synthase N-terminal-like domain-containing protein [Nevskiaceae bacterium]